MRPHPKGTTKFPSFQAFIYRSNMLGLVDKVKGFFAVLAIFGQDVRASRRKTLITIIVCALGCTALSAFVLKRLQQKQIQSTPSSRSLKGTNNTKFTSQIKGMKITISTLGVWHISNDLLSLIRLFWRRATHQKVTQNMMLFHLVLQQLSSWLLKMMSIWSPEWTVTKNNVKQWDCWMNVEYYGQVFLSMYVVLQNSLIRSQKVLFCGTAEGRIHMTRQLDSQLHIDGIVWFQIAHDADDAKVINSLQPFVPNLLHVGTKDTINTTNQAPNISTTSDLSQFLLSL